MIDPSQIHENMEAVGCDGEHIGTVDYLEGQTRIKLTHYSSRSGQFHHIPVDWIDRIDGAKLWLKKTRAEAVYYWHPQPIDPNSEKGTVHGGIP